MTKDIAVGDRFVDKIYNDFPHKVTEIRIGDGGLFEYHIVYEEDGAWEWQTLEQMKQRSKPAEWTFV